ncbi:MAG: LuxR C-terminal-related transcriptional regulator [Roseiflexaceae bacterium]
MGGVALPTNPPHSLITTHRCVVPEPPIEAAMLIPLRDTPIVTKLAIPQLAPQHLIRQALLDRLNQSLQGPLTLLSAHAGTGKTSLLSAWAQQAAIPVAWLTLDARESDRALFWQALLNALMRALPDQHEALIGLVAQIEASDRHAVPIGLINLLATAAQPVILILDDYHLIDQDPQRCAVHHDLDFLIQYLPTTLRIAIASRVDPPLRLAPLRGRGVLSELRSTDLRFNYDEVLALLNQRQIMIEPHEVRLLAERTDGWAVGLHVASLGLRSAHDPAAFLAHFAGNSRPMSEYLAAEVLQAIPSDLQDVLVATALVPRFSAALAEVLVAQATGRVINGQEVLNLLEQADLFLLPIDPQHRWFRYQYLFAEYLRAVLAQRWPDRVAALRQSAATWFEQHALFPEAVGQLLELGDQAGALRLMPAAARDLLRRGEERTLLQLFERLPSERIAADPQLALDRAWALVQHGQFDQVERWIHAINTTAANVTPLLASAEQQAEYLALRAVMAAFSGDYHSAADLAREGMQILPAVQAGSLRGRLNLVAGISSLFEGDAVTARRAIGAARNDFQEAEMPFFAAAALTIMGELHSLQGELRQAHRIYQQALRAQGTHAHGGQHAHIPFMAMARLRYQWNDLVGTRRALADGIAHLRGDRFSPLIADCYIMLAMVHQAEGDLTGALAILRRAELLARRDHHAHASIDLIAIFRARIALEQGDYDSAIAWFRSHPHSSPEIRGLMSMVVTELHALTRARVLCAIGDHQQALTLLDQQIQLAQNELRLGGIIDGLAHRAVVLAALGQADQARSDLSQALVLAEPEGFVRLFLDLGAPIRALLQPIAATTSLAGHYAQQILAAAEQPNGGYLPTPLPYTPAKPTAPALPAPVTLDLPEQLSERELEVLRLLATERSNREIAETLFIAPATLKVHLKNIYGKLGVHNRSQAILRAQSLRIVTISA